MPRSELIPERFNPRVGEFFDMQEDLHARHPEWGKPSPEQAVSQLLWMVGELGEVIDIIKKAPREAYMCSGPTRDKLDEELCDVAMYFIDSCMCFGITADEFAVAFKHKHEYDMRRDYEAQNRRKYGGSRDNAES